MPKQITDLKKFLEISKRKDVTGIKLKKTAITGGKKNYYKFKIRCSKYLYTLVVSDASKAKKLKESFPPGIEVKEI